MPVKHIITFSDSEDFEKRIDDFLEKLNEIENGELYPSFKLIDIKYTCSIAELGTLYTALIIYEQRQYL